MQSTVAGVANRAVEGHRNVIEVARPIEVAVVGTKRIRPGDAEFQPLGDVLAGDKAEMRGALLVAQAGETLMLGVDVAGRYPACEHLRLESLLARDRVESRWHQVTVARVEDDEAEADDGGVDDRNDG